MEKWDAQKSPFEGRGPAFRDPVNRDGARIRGDNGIAARRTFNARDEFLFHLQAFHDRFNDPVRVRDAVEMFVKIADRDTPRRPFCEEGRGTEILRLFKRPFYDRVLIAIITRQVQQMDAQPCVGKVGRNLRSHHSGPSTAAVRMGLWWGLSEGRATIFVHP